MLNGLWEEKFEELAKFNSEPDKTKFSDQYIDKMAALQKEFDEKRMRLARQQGVIVV